MFIKFKLIIYSLNINLYQNSLKGKVSYELGGEHNLQNINRLLI